MVVDDEQHLSIVGTARTGPKSFVHDRLVECTEIETIESRREQPGQANRRKDLLQSSASRTNSIARQSNRKHRHSSISTHSIAIAR